MYLPWRCEVWSPRRVSGAGCCKSFIYKNGGLVVEKMMEVLEVGGGSDKYYYS